MVNQHVVSLQAENVKRLKAVHIQPNGNVVVVGGKNGAGKSSTLDAIEWALGGKPDATLPIRAGESAARIVCETEDYRVTRKFSASGSSLSIESKNGGGRLSSPQALLDKMVGRLSFDPLAFLRMDGRKQADRLRELTGLDFSGLDARRKALYEERTGVNREIKIAEARRDAIPIEATPPAEDADPQSLADQMAQLNKTILENRSLRDKLNELKSESARLFVEITDLAKEIERLRAELESKWTAHREIGDRIITAEPLVAALVDPSVDELAAKIESARQAEKVRERMAERDTLARQVLDLTQKADGITAEIAAIDNEKERSLAHVPMPVEGLGFSSSGEVTYKRIPFSQASSAEQLRVSVGMAIAANPQLRVMLIRDGSLLDESNLATIAEMAHAHDVQVWIERVGNGKEVSVLIEDGQVSQQ